MATLKPEEMEDAGWRHGDEGWVKTHFELGLEWYLLIPDDQHGASKCDFCGRKLVSICPACVDRTRA